MIFGRNSDDISAEKGHVWKESWITTQGRRELEVGTLLLGIDKNNIIANKLFLVFKLQVWSIRHTFRD